MKHAIAIIIVASLLAATPLWADEAKMPKVEVVFVLDTTGSMSGLIQAAKDKIWAIANTLATTKPTPDIKMGLVGFRDRGDSYITKLTTLTDDLDLVFKELMAFGAGGGGDTPESVNQALDEAINKFQWSKNDETYRVVFLVGDSPPHMDYPDDVKYEVTCKAAAKSGITINTIQCGDNTSTTQIWDDIARKAEGRFMRIAQSGGSFVASTPFDAELASLSQKLDATRLYYGDVAILKKNEQRKSRGDAIYESASKSSLAQRAAFNVGGAGARNFGGEQELIQDIESKSVTLDDIKEDQLPKEMQKMSKAERDKFVKDRQANREELKKKIKELSDKRQAHMLKLAKEKGMNDADSFDKAVFDCIKVQAGKKGILYEGDVQY
jgi:uncharacterized protein YegL